jgi:hypothetical protein
MCEALPAINIDSNCVPDLPRFALHVAVPEGQVMGGGSPIVVASSEHDAIRSTTKRAAVGTKAEADEVVFFLRFLRIFRT